MQDLETELACKLAIITVNHEWLHFVLWHFVGLESPQGYDNILKRMGFYTIQKAHEWKIYPEIASLEGSYAAGNRKNLYDSFREKKPKKQPKIEKKGKE